MTHLVLGREKSGGREKSRLSVHRVPVWLINPI